MKILATSDWHIWDYPNYSEYDVNGIPSRLKMYEYLAEDLAQIALKHKCAAIVVAGDTIHGPTARPMVLSVARRVFEILTETRIPIIVTTGQHDCDSKAENMSPEHSVLTSIIPNDEHILYFPTADTCSIGSTTFYVEPWKPGEVDYGAMENADIFVGHGMIHGARDLFGYMFTGGFNVHRLYEKYRISIIGDIHNAQVFANDQHDRTVLLPGQPVSTNFSSAEPAGVWVIDCHTTLAKFIPIYPKRPEVYHRFLRVTEPSQIDDNAINTHYNLRPATSRDSTRYDGSEADGVPTTNLLDTATQHLGELKVGHQKEIEGLLRDAYGKLTIKSRSIPQQQRLISVDISNFLSIREFGCELDLLKGNTLIIGPNGSGKTSLAEAILWSFTGKTTKDVSVHDITNNQAPKGKEAEVTLAFEVAGVKYRINRSRAHGLHLWREAESTTDLTKGSIRETQSLIYEILGVTDRDILTLTYFSTNSLSTFGDLTQSDQLDMLGRLSDIEHLDAFRESYGALLEKLKEKYQQITGKRMQLEERQTSIKKNLAEIEVEDLEEDTSEIDAVREIIRQIPYLRAETAYGLQQQIDISVSKIEPQIDKTVRDEEIKLTTAMSTLKGKQRVTLRDLEHSVTDVQRLDNKLEDLKIAMAEAKSGECPTCHQRLQDEEVLNGIVKQVKETSSAKKTKVSEQEVAREKYKTSKKQEETLSKKSNDLVPKLERQKKLEVALNQLTWASRKLGALKPPADHKAEIKIYTKELQEVEAKIADLSSRVPALQEIYDAAKGASKLLARNGAVARSLITSVATKLAENVNQIVGNPGLLELTVNVGAKITINASFRGKKPVALGAFSGGERRMVDSIIMIALSRMVNDGFGLETGILGITIFDEVFTYLDDIYGDVIFDSLDHIPSPLTLIITHDSRLASHFQKVIRVTNKGGFSEYEIMQ